MQLVVNGIARVFESLSMGASVAALVEQLGFRADRVALEQNGAIVPRSQWAQTEVHEADRFEVVHFVGGGAPAAAEPTVISSSVFSHS